MRIKAIAEIVVPGVTIALAYALMLLLGDRSPAMGFAMIQGTLAVVLHYSVVKQPMWLGIALTVIVTAGLAALTHELTILALWLLWTGVIAIVTRRLKWPKQA